MYTDSQYESSLQGFEQLREDEQFGAVAPHYLTQIYYKTGRYEPLIQLAEEILKKEEVIRREEIIRLLADAYYRSEDFVNAAIYLERYKAAGARFKEKDRFQLGYCYFRTGRYLEAIDAFNKITDASGVLSQEAWYHLGDCYLKTGEKTKALTAFEAASQSGSDAEIEREARYLFVKINYEVERALSKKSVVHCAITSTPIRPTRRKRERSTPCWPITTSTKRTIQGTRSPEGSRSQKCGVARCTSKSRLLPGHSVDQCRGDERSPGTVQGIAVVRCERSAPRSCPLLDRRSHYRQKEYNKAIDGYLNSEKARALQAPLNSSWLYMIRTMPTID